MILRAPRFDGRRVRREQQRDWHRHYVWLRIASVQGHGRILIARQWMERRRSDSQRRWFWREPQDAV